MSQLHAFLLVSVILGTPECVLEYRLMDGSIEYLVRRRLILPAARVELATLPESLSSHRPIISSAFTTLYPRD